MGGTAGLDARNIDLSGLPVLVTPGGSTLPIREDSHHSLMGRPVKRAIAAQEFALFSHWWYEDAI